MNRYKIINDFLLKWRDISINCNLDLLPSDARLSNAVYSDLVRIGIDPNDKNYDVSEMCFKSWIDNFKSKQNTNAFFSESSSYFCQFTYNQQQLFSSPEHIKIYVPLDSQHIENGVNDLFSFMDKEKIIHSSKVGKRIRFDDVVIRVSNLKDAKKIADYIANNEYIQEGLISPNPFAYSKDGIAYACDGYGSYNELVSNTIMDYINSRIKSNDSEKICINDFVSYSISQYNKHLVDDTLEQLMNKLCLNYLGAHGYEVKNFSQVMRLFLTSLNPEYTQDDFLNQYRLNCEIYRPYVKENVALQDIDKEKILNDNIIGTFEKHGEKHVIAALSQLLTHQTYMGFTRKNSNGEILREKLMNNVSKENAISIINSNLGLGNSIVYDDNMYSSMAVHYCKLMIQEYLNSKGLSSDFTGYKSIG